MFSENSDSVIVTRCRHSLSILLTYYCGYDLSVQSFGLMVYILFCAHLDRHIWNFLFQKYDCYKYVLGFEHAKEEDKVIICCKN